MSVENQEKQEKVSREFEEMIRRWVKIDDEIRDKNAELREMKEDKKQYEEYILHCIEQINKDMTINIDNGNGVIRRSVTQSRGPLKKDIIQSVLLDVTKDQNQAIKLTEVIYNSRPVKEKINLKRSTIRKKK